MTKIKVKCIGCKATRDIDSSESAQLAADLAVPICEKCGSVMVAVSARGGSEQQRGGMAT